MATELLKSSNPEHPRVGTSSKINIGTLNHVRIADFAVYLQDRMREGKTHMRTLNTNVPIQFITHDNTTTDDESE